MWIETDHHGMVNLDYVKRIDLAGEIEKNTFGIYLFDVDGTTYPIVDVSRFRNIGVFQGKETDQDVHTAVYTFYMIAKRLIADRKDRDVITIEAIYKEFASEWYAQQKKEMAAAEEEPGRAGGAGGGRSPGFGRGRGRPGTIGESARFFGYEAVPRCVRPKLFDQVSEETRSCATRTKAR